MDNNANKIFLCGTCGEKFKCETEICDHMLKVHNLRVREFQHRLKCDMCVKTFNRKSSLHRHVRAVHKMEIPLHRPNSQLKCPLKCDMCVKTFNRKSSLHRHLREVHKMEIPLHRPNSQLKCPEPLCSLDFYDRMRLRQHIKKCHGVTIEFDVEHFQTYNDFQLWKEKIERETNTRYACCHSPRQSSERKTQNFVCHRSGFFESKSDGKKKPRTKSLTTVKINGWCPASMDIVITPKGVDVTHYKTHFGHEHELDTLFLTPEEKTEIAGMLQQGVVFEKILDEIRDSVGKDTDISRLHLLSRKDLHNICQQEKISNKENSKEHKYPDLETWVDSMKVLGDDTPVIYFKGKGTKELQFKKKDSFLVVMTDTQQEILQESMHKILCVDYIHHVLQFNHYLITLMTLDFQDNCYPLAFCITNSVNYNTMSLFFRLLKGRVGTISANHFMSVDNPAFYSAWQNVMGPVNHELFCNWYLDRNWYNKLLRLPTHMEQKIRTYRSLKLLIIEERLAEFQSMFQDTLSMLEKDDITKKFASYFRENYEGNCEKWANCYRSKDLLRSSSILEETHKSLRDCYIEAESVSSVVKLLNSVIALSRDKVLKTYYAPNKLLTALVEEMNSQGDKDIDVIEPKEIHLQVPTVEEEYCFVEHREELVCPPDCKPFCSVCCLCFHKFTCSCIEHFLNKNVCRHIQASIDVLKGQCIHLKEQSVSSRSGETALPSVSKGQCESVKRKETISPNVAKRRCESVNHPTAVSPSVPKEQPRLVKHPKSILPNVTKGQCGPVDHSTTVSLNVAKEQCESAKRWEALRNVANEVVIDASTDKDMITSDEEACAVEQVLMTDSEENGETNLEEREVKKQRSLLQKMARIQYFVENSALTPEMYARINEFLDNLINMFKDC